MQDLKKEDYDLIEAAQKAIRLNYDAKHDNHVAKTEKFMLV